LNSIITDSAPGAACYSTGNKCNNNQQGVFPDDTLAKFDNPRVELIGEYLGRTEGKALGIVTTADVFDATPAAFGSHTQDRGAGTGSLAPLFLAAGDTDPAILKLLLAHGADPAVEDENGATPLSRAISAGTLHGPDRPMFGGCRVETVRALIAHDPALRLKRNAAWNDAIWWARFQRCQEVLRLIGE